MDADRVNRFVAEKVMKWELRNEHWFRLGSWVSAGRNIHNFRPYDCFADCNLVLEAIKRDGWDIGLECFQETKQWRCWIVRIDDTHDDGPVTEDDKEFSTALIKCVAIAYGYQE